MGSAGRIKGPRVRKPRKKKGTETQGDAVSEPQRYGPGNYPGDPSFEGAKAVIRDLESKLPPVDAPDKSGRKETPRHKVVGADGFKAPDYAPETAGGLILGGDVTPCAVPVFNWHDHGLEFEVGDGARRRHPKQIDLDLFVLHWTGGEAPPPRMYKVLDRRELGIEFAIGATGDVWQFCDPLKVDTFDAGPYNRRSIGVEIVNYGFGAGRNRANRTHYNCVLNGSKRRFAHFFPAQIKAAVALVDAVIESGKTKIVRTVPRTPDKSFLARKMAKSELAQFQGVCGHFHISMKKSDPGLDIFRELIKCGF